MYHVHLSIRARLRVHRRSLFGTNQIKTVAFFQLIQLITIHDGEFSTCKTFKPIENVISPKMKLFCYNCFCVVYLHAIVPPQL